MNTATLPEADLRTHIEQHLSADLRSVNDILLRSLKSPSPFVTNVVEHVSRYGGKQIRPILLLLMNRMLADHSSDAAKTLAAAVEMIHLATLVHDDVIDEAETRRHVSTVHRRWNTETSVLLGDFLFSRSFHLAATSGDASACVLIGRATDRTCEGELNQIAARLERSLSEIDYFRIVRDKTGQLFSLSCHLGALASGASAEQCRAAKRFGMRLGMAFQIADDVLDVTQSTASTGKDEANDLQNGRRTLPILRALEAGRNNAHNESSAELQQLNQMLNGEHSGSPAEFGDLKLVQIGLESAMQTASSLVSRAISDLRDFPAGIHRQLLESIAAYAIRRER